MDQSTLQHFSMHMYKAYSSNKCQQIPASAQTGLYKKHTVQTAFRSEDQVFKNTLWFANSEYKLTREVFGLVPVVGCKRDLAAWG